MAVNWNYYSQERFTEIDERYLPPMGEGETMATQVVAAVNKLIYKWYNDGDVFDNTGNLSGWCNDLSNYANWLHRYVPIAAQTLEKVHQCWTEEDYEDLLQEIANKTLNKELLELMEDIPAKGSIYRCEGPFRFEEKEEEEVW